MIRKTVLAILLAATGVSAHANTITQWNFNSKTSDANTATGITTPAIGNGIASLINTTATFASGDASGGSSDPVIGDDSGWNTSGYAAQGTGNKTEGVEFKVSTVGFTNVQFSYDLRHSNTSSRYEMVQYSLNGNTFNDFATFDGNLGDTWFNGRTVNFSSILGANNNADFAIRVVAAFAPNASAYAASSPTGTYGTAGTWRFDMATVSAAPVPEPKNYAMLLRPKSLSHIDKAIQLDPYEPMAYVEKGNSLMYRPTAFGGDKKEGLAEYRKALKLLDDRNKDRCSWQKMLLRAFILKALYETNQTGEADKFMLEMQKDYGSMKWIGQFVGAEYMDAK